MHALAKFRRYLVGIRFVVRNDHNNLRYLLERDLNDRQHKWIIKVQPYDFYTKYVKGNKNIIIDSLSRRPAAFSMTKISTN